MPDQASIFGNSQAQATPANNQPAGGNGGTAQNTDDLATLLGSIRNERGEPKYRTIQDALVALRHSQEYIPNLKNEKETLEQKLNEVLPKLNKVTELERTLTELTQKVNEPVVTTQPAGMTEEQVAALISTTLTKQQQAAIQQTNINTVSTSVKAKFGDKSEEVFYSKARELGLTNEEFNSLAAKTPKAVLKLLGIEDTVAPVNSYQPVRVNTDGFTPAQDSNIGRNKKPALIGATSQDLLEESARAKKMVDELAEQGLSINDLTNPKMYNKFFAR